MAKIGFIGLGNMGMPMAKNLIKAGHEVKAFDLSAAALDHGVEAGMAPAATVSEAASGVEVVVTMVPEGKHSRAVYLNDDGILAKADAGTLLIDCSTIDVATARDINAAATEAGFEMVDAPVSGGVGGAEAATLTFMVGGTKGAFQKAEKILKPMGGKIFHCGGAGNGEAVKICNNMLLAISMIGTSEAFALGRRLGLDDQVLFDVASTSSGRCWSLDTYCPVPGPVPGSPANRDYQPGFAADMMLKDLRLAKTAAKATEASTPLGALSEALYSELSEKGHGNLDFSGIFKMVNQDI
ncbi:MAG: 3-hydroxyisobutyrate dehydrogenase [Alphaproteobacteria bacterium]|nr:MAG: 3-hydroxyisobutyrate dehydrogenase [Alphaproteobacteria bacterium]